MTNPGRMLRLRDDIRIYASDESHGYLEHDGSVKRLESEHLGAIVSRLVPLLDEGITIGELTEVLGPVFGSHEVRSAVDTLEAVQAISNEADDGTTSPTPFPRLNFVGDPWLSKRVELTLRALVNHETDVHSSANEITILTTRSAFDTAATRIEAELLASERRYICVGVTQREHGFVGPLHESGMASPCLECMRTRLNSNSAYGRLRREYGEWLAHTSRQPSLVRPRSKTIAMLTAWLLHRLSDEEDTADRNATRLTLVDSQRMIVSSHTLLPVPNCSICHCHQTITSKSTSLVPEDALDSKVGIVHSLRTFESDRGPSIFLAGTTSADSSFVRSNMRAVNNGGAGFTEKDARISAICESLERYAAGVYSSDQLKFASWEHLDGEAVDPESFVKFSDEQYATPGFPFARFLKDTKVRWVRATRWSDKASVWVPASQVYLPYRRVPDEQVVAQSISSGMAAGRTYEEAVLRGLQEVVERDSLAISWMHRLPPREMTDETAMSSEIVSSYLDSSHDWNVTFHELTLDSHLRTVAAVMDDGSTPSHIMGFGCACRTNIADATEKAFVEAIQGLTYITRLLPKYTDWNPGIEFEHVDDFNHHAILYSKFPDLRSRVEYLVDGKQDSRQHRPAYDARLDRGNGGLDAIAVDMATAGYEIYVVDLTPPDVAMLGISVVRVLVPGYVHLSGTHRWRFLGSERLLRLPRTLGFESTPNNPFPHPLP